MRGTTNFRAWLNDETLDVESATQFVLAVEMKKSRHPWEVEVNQWGNVLVHRNGTRHLLVISSDKAANALTDVVARKFNGGVVAAIQKIADQEHGESLPEQTHSDPV